MTDVAATADPQAVGAEPPSNSLGAIVRRHETLRTAFGSVEGRLVQEIPAVAAAPAPPPLPTRPLRSSAEGAAT